MRGTSRPVSAIVVMSLVALRSVASSFEIPSRSTLPRIMPSTSALQMSSTTNFKVLGICGGIGSGKSTAAKLLVSECSCLVHLDADALAHSVYSPGSQAVHDIAAAFGPDVLVEGTFEIDRKKLGAIVFADRKDMAVSTIIGLVYELVLLVFVFLGWVLIHPCHHRPDTRTLGLAPRQDPFNGQD